MGKRLSNEPPTNAVEGGIHSVQEFISMGRTSTPETVHPKTLYQAKQLGRALSETELKKVFELAREHQCVVSPRLLLRLSSVPLKDRWKVLEMAIKGHWTLRRVEAELSHRYGRKGRGKAPKVPKDPTEFAYELLRSANWWLRFKEMESELPLPRPARSGVKDVWREMQELKNHLEKILPPNPDNRE